MQYHGALNFQNKCMSTKCIQDVFNAPFCYCICNHHNFKWLWHIVMILSDKHKQHTNSLERFCLNRESLCKQ